VYQRYGLDGSYAVMAHNVHATDRELERMASAGTSVAHCPCNAALGSGLFRSDVTWRAFGVRWIDVGAEPASGC
jgi:cytosine/adenosine deaminase-related metal-dependent hydrolase